MFEIVRYTADKASEWNQFVAQSKNGTFLFDRQYMDYHSDRFKDYSLMFYHQGKLYALLPANQDGDTLCSHRGLTYGGLLMTKEGRTATVRDLFIQLNEYLRQQGFHHVVYKRIPWVYATLPAEEDLFALSNVCHAVLKCRDVASVVDLMNRLPFTYLRRRGVKKALENGLCIKQIDKPKAFWSLLEENLMNRYQAKPVHTQSEIELLQNRFPSNILLYGAYHDNALLGGTVLYISRHIVKTQYISANEEGKKMGALDLLFANLLDKYASEGMTFFDFGTSNKIDNDDLNDSLIFQKEGFGGRGLCYDIYEYDL